MNETTEREALPVSMSARRFLVALFAITVVALAGRVAYALTVASHTTHSLDELGYVAAATSLGEGRGFDVYPPFGPPHRIESADHAPLTSIILAPIAVLSGNDDGAMRATVAVVGASVVLLVGLLGRSVGGPRAGLVAAGIAAIYPNLWSHDGLIMSETFAALGTVATLLCVWLLIRLPNWRTACAAGFACAIAILSRGELLLLMPMLVLPAVLGLRRLPWPRRLQLFGIVAFVAALVLTPWVAYNLSRFEQPVFISYSDGGVLSGSNCDRTWSGALFGFWDGRCHPTTSKTGDESVLAAEARDDGLHYARAHLDRLPLVVAAREGRLWGVYRINQMAHIAGETEGIPTEVTWAGWAMYWILVVLAIRGAMRLFRARVGLWPIVAPFAVVAVVAALFYGHTRFRIPAEISLVVLAALALAPSARAAPGNTSREAPSRPDSARRTARPW